jgi:DMSO/TMAO reductase YedYZ molybdopterin-dependent catalytic subunit
MTDEAHPVWGCGVVPRLGIPKSAKNLQAIQVTRIFPGGFWENQGHDWFSGV